MAQAHDAADVPQSRGSVPRNDEPLLLTILHSLPGAALVCSADGRILALNAATESLFGYTREQLTGRAVETLVPQRIRDRHVEHRKSYAADPRTRRMGERFNLVGVRADGTEFPAAVSLGHFADDNGTVTIALVDNMSEFRTRDPMIVQMNDRLSRDVAMLEEANRELEAFSYSVSHDLRAPLRAIDGFSHLLEADYADLLGEHGRNFIAHIRDSAQRMGLLIDDLLNLARVSRSELARRPVDLSALAREVASVLQERAADRAIECNIATGIRTVGDAGLLHIVLENLFGNAFKFTKGRAPARIDFGEQNIDGTAALFVRDNGVGFDMAYAGKLFRPFQRLHSEREFPGTGIGLALVQRIIKKHGGRVWVDAASGRGACFYFTV
jgi:PAS domain S-box-containing protein